MPFLRLAVIFAFFVFSLARAACLDFEIFANQNSLGCDATVSVNTTYGDPLILSVSPPTGYIRWKVGGTNVGAEPIYVPVLVDNEAQTITFFVEKDGISKTVNVNLLERPSYTVSFDTDGGAPSVPSQSVLKDSLAQKPTETLTKTGYDFDGWDFDFSTPITKDITIKAKWKIKAYTVSFNTNGGSNVASQLVDYNSLASIPPVPPTKTGYDFDGWDFDFNTPITKDTTIEAKWKIKIYTVSFNSDGGSDVASQLVDYNSLASIPLVPPTKTGYDFDGWDFDFSTPITKDTTIKAKWKAKQYTINFNAEGGTVSPASKKAAYNEAVGDLPEPVKAAHKFMGWFISGGTQFTKTTIYSYTNDITLYAQWEFVKGTRPTEAMLDYLLQNQTYNGMPIAPIEASQKADVIGELGTITVLYNGKNTLPKDAGNYVLSAFIAKSDDYDSATVLLGNFDIAKASVTITVTSATAQNKIYDATTKASITSVFFNASLFSSDYISENDYFANADFASPDVGEDIEIFGTISWLPNGPLSKNYNLLPVAINNVKANIMQATGFLQISVPKNYELSNPTRPGVINRSSYIKEEDIIWEYRKEDESTYSNQLPNRIGNWLVKAYFNTTPNYTGAVDSAIFSVTRGNAMSVMHIIEFAEPGFYPDTELSKDLQHYFVAGASLCKIENTQIQITIKELDVNLKIGNSPQRGNQDENGFMHYEIPFAFGKPGLHTFIYELYSKDGIYSEFDTVLIETPVPFETVAVQKWNNVLFVNNNSQTNGGYEFTDFKWFKNNEEAGYLQFYSAGPSSADTLNPSDIYKIVMQSADGTRISTCEGKAKIKASAQTLKQTLTKQVLGINEKSMNNDSKIYNIKGKLAKKTPAGVYIVEEYK
jgi:hypothetical protein